MYSSHATTTISLSLSLSLSLTHTHTHTHTGAQKECNWDEREEERRLVLFVELNLRRSFEGMGGMKVTSVRRKKIPSLWSTVIKTALARSFSFNHTAEVHLITQLMST